MSQHSAPADPSSAIWQHKTPQVKFDFGAMLKARPQLCRISQLLVARMSWLGLSLQAHVVLSSLDHLPITLLLDCINVVDYSLRPANPATLEGGPLIEYDEKNHELLNSVNRCVPNTDGEESWDPAVKFAVLTIDQSYIIAQRFEARIDYGNVIGLTTQQEQRRSEHINATTAWLEQFRVPASQGRASGRIRSARGS